jgi:phage-related protein
LQACYRRPQPDDEQKNAPDFMDQGGPQGVRGAALAYRGNAFRVVYAVQLGQDLWVVHAFQKKATRGIKTPPREIALIENRLRRLEEMLR